MSPLRSVVLSFAAYVQIVLCYGYIYYLLSDPAIGKFIIPEATKQAHYIALDAIFLNFGTITTEGYGALIPVGSLAQMIVSSELMFGLYFVVIILAQVSAWSSHSKVELGQYNWRDVESAPYGGIDRPPN